MIYSDYYNLSVIILAVFPDSLDLVPNELGKLLLNPGLSPKGQIIK